MNEKDFEEITGLPSKMMELTLSELVTKYGGPMQLDKWAGILSKLVNVSLMEEKIRVSKLNDH